VTPNQYRTALERLGLTQESAAEFLGVSLRTSHGYANGSPIPEATAKLLKLMVRLNLKPEDC
jgi:DNA-binding XRE family transcriptional regulator